MSDSTELLVWVFNEEDKAGEVLKVMGQMSKEAHLPILNAAVLVKHRDGKTAMKETQDVDAKHGALFGAITGALIGLIEGPVGAVVGAVIGATTGGVAAHTIDSGFPDEYLKELRAGLRPDSSALVVLTEHEQSDKIVEALARFQGRVIRHVLTENIAAYLAAVSMIDADKTPLAELPAKLEAQIAASEADIEALMAKVTPMDATAAAEVKTQLVNLRTKQRRMQERLHDILMAEIHVLNTKIKALKAQLATAPVTSDAKLQTELETVRAKRRAAREKLYEQTEMRIKGWQAEIEDLKARQAEAKGPGKSLPTTRAAALQVFESAFQEGGLPETETEVNARLADLPSRIESLEAELQSHLETQIEGWQAEIEEMRAYMTTLSPKDQTEINRQIEDWQAKVAAAQAKLKTHIAGQISLWNAEIETLRAQIATVDAAEQARINEQIAALQAKIEELRSQTVIAATEDQAKINERIAALQAKITAAQAKLKA